MPYTLAPATLADAHELVPLLRESDRAEILAMNMSPEEGVVVSLRASREAWTARADGEILCMTGIAPLTAIGPTGVPWLVGTDIVPRHARHFLCESHRLVERWLEMFPVLRTFVDSRYKQAIRWLDHAGFRVRDPVYVANGLFWIAEKERL